MTIEKAYGTMFTDDPDVLDIKNLSRLLKISVKTAYKLLQRGEINCQKVGREYRIPKIRLIEYVLKTTLI